MSVFEHETILPCSAEELFNFLIQPANVSKVSHPDLGIRFVSPPEVLSEGIELEFQIVSFGQIHTLKHKIVQFERPRIVIEEQIVGPMKSWRHHHEYLEHENGCVKRDRVDFQPPGGMIGFFLTEDKILDQLEDGMFNREQRLLEFIEQGLLT